MSKVYRIFNIDKKEYLDANSFPDGGKIGSFLRPSECGILSALFLLLDADNSNGWSNSRITIENDYNDSYFDFEESYKDIRSDMLEEILEYKEEEEV